MPHNYNLINWESRLSAEEKEIGSPNGVATMKEERAVIAFLIRTDSLYGYPLLFVSGTRVGVRPFRVTVISKPS